MLSTIMTISIDGEDVEVEVFGCEDEDGEIEVVSIKDLDGRALSLSVLSDDDMEEAKAYIKEDLELDSDDDWGDDEDFEDDDWDDDEDDEDF